MRLFVCVIGLYVGLFSIASGAQDYGPEVIGTAHGYCSDIAQMKARARADAAQKCRTSIALVRQVSEWELLCVDHVPGEQSSISARFECRWW